MKPIQIIIQLIKIFNLPFAFYQSRLEFFFNNLFESACPLHPCLRNPIDSLMKKNPFLKDISRPKPSHLQFPFQREPSAEESLPSSQEDSLLLDGIDAQIFSKSPPQSEKDFGKNQRIQNNQPNSQINQDGKNLSFLQKVSNPMNFLLQKLHVGNQSSKKRFENIFKDKHPEIHQHIVTKPTVNEFFLKSQENAFIQEMLTRPKESGETKVECNNSFVDMSFGDSSPGPRNLRNVPMTRSIITVGSAFRDQQIPSPQLTIKNYERLSQYGLKNKFSEKSPNQNSSDDFPEAKSQQNQSESDKSPIDDQILNDYHSNLLQISQIHHFAQQESDSQSQSNPNQSHPSSNPFTRADNYLQKNKESANKENGNIYKKSDLVNNQDIRNSKNQQTRIRRSRSHSQPNIKSKEKKPQAVIIHPKPEPHQQKSSPKNKLIKKSIIDQLDADISSDKDQKNPRNNCNHLNTESQKTISIHVNDTNSTSSIFQYFKDKQNRRANQKIANQISIMEEESEKKSKIQNPIKNLPPMNQSIDFNTLKSKSKPKNAFLSTKNNQKNLKQRLTQKFKKELDHLQNFTEQRLMTRTRTQNTLNSLKDIVIKLVLENQKEHLQNMVNEMISCMQEIEEATNMARLERKLMSKNLNKAKKQISALKDLNIKYEDFLDEMCEVHNKQIHKTNEKFRAKFSAIGVTIESGKIIFTEQMAQEYIDFKKKEQLRSKKNIQRQKLRQAELKSIQSPNDPCQMLLISPSNEQLFEIMKKRSEDESNLILNFIDFRNMMINTYLGVCLEKYPNTIPERLSLLERRDQEIIEFFRSNGISIPNEFLKESKKMLQNVQKIVEEQNQK